MNGCTSATSRFFLALGGALALACGAGTAEARRDKALEATLQSKGHIVADAVTKKTTHLVHADGAAATSTKLIKAQEMGIKILSLSDFKHLV